MDYLAWGIVAAAYFFLLWPALVGSHEVKYMEAVLIGFMVTALFAVVAGAALGLIWAIGHLIHG